MITPYHAPEGAGFDARDAAFVEAMRRAGRALEPAVRHRLMALLTASLDPAEWPAEFVTAMRAVVADEIELMAARLLAQGAAWWRVPDDAIGAARGTA